MRTASKIFSGIGLVYIIIICIISKRISTLKHIIHIYKDLVVVFDDQNETRLPLNVSVEGQGSLATPSVCLTVASALLLRLLPTLV